MNNTAITNPAANTIPGLLLTHPSIPVKAELVTVG
jgi:hypothetical protein